MKKIKKSLQAAGCALRAFSKSMTANQEYTFMDEAYLLDVDPKTLSLESLFKFKAALMHKLIYINVEEKRRLKILAENAREMAASQKEYRIFADGVARVSALNAVLIPELEHMIKS